MSDAPPPRSRRRRRKFVPPVRRKPPPSSVPPPQPEAPVPPRLDVTHHCTYGPHSNRKHKTYPSSGFFHILSPGSQKFRLTLYTESGTLLSKRLQTSLPFDIDEDLSDSDSEGAGASGAFVHLNVDGEEFSFGRFDICCGEKCLVREGGEGGGGHLGGSSLLCSVGQGGVFETDDGDGDGDDGPSGRNSGAVEKRLQKRREVWERKRKKRKKKKEKRRIRKKSPEEITQIVRRPAAARRRRKFVPPMKGRSRSHDASTTTTTTTGILGTPQRVPVPPPLDAFVIATDCDGWDIFIDSFLARKLRKHQIEGVQFMYECVSGIRSEEDGNHRNRFRGVVLGDEMGMGKTLQSVALIWMLLKRGGRMGRPMMKKVIVVTNSSLVMNWRKEFKIWLGDARLVPLVCSSKTAQKTPQETIRDFAHGYFPVMLISYSLCSLYQHLLCDCRCDLLVCDEGHKLKSDDTKVYQALLSIPTNRRVILTGTPIQNRLVEFYHVMNFVNESLLAQDKREFRRLYGVPIQQSREVDASAADISLGKERSHEMNELVNRYFLRRTMSILQAILPPRHIFYVFLKMSELQQRLYRRFVDSPDLWRLLSGSPDSSDILYMNALGCIQSLKKLLTHPSVVYSQLVENDAAAGESGRDWWDVSMIDLFPPDYGDFLARVFDSTKLLFIRRLLLTSLGVETGLDSTPSPPSRSRKRKRGRSDKFVIVSNFTSILDVIERMLGLDKIAFLRLDGSVPSNKRMPLVDQFNTRESIKVFLLSARAGGTGLNLVAANRIILFDPDWNPRVDEQAMARIWRQGQTREVFVYRLVQTATVEEKIVQRQLVKMGLSRAVTDETLVASKFSHEFLRELFVFDPHSDCETFGPSENLLYEWDVLGKTDPVFARILQEFGDDRSDVAKKVVSFVKLAAGQDDGDSIEDRPDGVSGLKMTQFEDGDVSTDVIMDDVDDPTFSLGDGHAQEEEEEEGEGLFVFEGEEDDPNPPKRRKVG